MKSAVLLTAEVIDASEQLLEAAFKSRGYTRIRRGWSTLGPSLGPSRFGRSNVSEVLCKLVLGSR